MDDELIQSVVVYHAGLDEAIAWAEDALLGRGAGLTCKKGCSLCCRLPLRATTAPREHCRSSSEPEIPPEILDAVKPLCMEYRRGLEAQGIKFDKAVDELPKLVVRFL